MNTQTEVTILVTLNQLALEIGGCQEITDISLSLDRKKHLLRWLFVHSNSTARADIRPTLSTELFSLNQMAKYGFLFLSVKKIFSMSTTRTALSLGILHVEDAPRVVQMIQQSLPDAFLGSLAEIRFYLLTPTHFFDFILKERGYVQTDDHPTLAAYAKIREIAKPLFYSKIISENEIIKYVNASIDHDRNTFTGNSFKAGGGKS